MVSRWPDGSMVPEDPHAAARRLDRETAGWLVWFGDATGHFWAVETVEGKRLVEAKTTDDLITQITSKTSATHPPPASPAPRGQGAPVSRGHRGRRALRGE